MFENFYMYNDLGMWFLQIAVGAIFIVHGWPKLKHKGLLNIGGPFHGLVEVVGGAALIAGWYVREVGMVFSVIMLGAIWFKMFKWNTPFTSNNTTGWEFDLILLAANLHFLTH